MFICYNCKNSTELHEPASKWVLETRRAYHDQGPEHKETLGYEIVKERLICQRCAKTTAETQVAA